jgi:hypothetical protein
VPKLPWELLTFREKSRIVLAAIAIGYVVLIVVHVLRRLPPNNGAFGSEWECTGMPKGGGPICFKK